MRPSVVRPLVLVLAALAAAPRAGAQPAASQGADRLAWLTGCWERRSGERVVEEHWLAPRGGVLLGVGRTTQAGALVEHEFVRIAEAGDTLVYHAAPSGQPAAEFRAPLPAAGAREIVFANPAHDFPQRVAYRAVGGDSLLARIEGSRGGAARAVDFAYARVPCGGTRPPARPVDTTPPLPSVTLPPALDRVLRDYERGWTAGDEAALAELFTADGFVLQGGRPPRRGRAAIREAYASAGAPVALRALAYATADSVGYIVGAYGERPGVDQGKFVLALRRGRDGRWRIAADMDNPSPRAAPPAAGSAPRE